MKKKLYRKEKLVLGSLVFLAVLVLAKSVVSERSMEGLGRSFSEIYDDRLVAESYIYKLNDLLYKKKISYLNERYRLAETGQETLSQDDEIALLLDSYGRTKLTTGERRVFSELKEDLGLLRQEEMAFREAGGKNGPLEVIRGCDQAIVRLQQLSTIQLMEGKQLSDHGRQILSVTQMGFHLEWIVYLLLLLAIFYLLRHRYLLPELPSSHFMN